MNCNFLLILVIAIITYYLLNSILPKTKAASRLIKVLKMANIICVCFDLMYCLFVKNLDISLSNQRQTLLKLTFVISIICIFEVIVFFIACFLCLNKKIRIISIFFICIFILKNKTIFGIILILFLIKSILIEIYNLKYKYNKFLLERYINNYNFKNTIIVSSIYKFKRDKKHIINNTFEHDFLCKLFDTTK